MYVCGVSTMEQWSGNIEAEIETKDSIKENKKTKLKKVILFRNMNI